jgi:hypothetical protein
MSTRCDASASPATLTLTYTLLRGHPPLPISDLLGGDVNEVSRATPPNHSPQPCCADNPSPEAPTHNFGLPL